MAVEAQPKGFHTVTPYLVVDGAPRLIDFLEAVFDAELVEGPAAPGERIGHAEVRIGDSVVMLGDAHGEHKPMQMMLYVYVDDVDITYQRALTAGASVVQPVADQFCGDRGGGVRDPFGNVWWIATHIEDVPPDELQRRARERMTAARD
jgi:PhnB protein